MSSQGFDRVLAAFEKGKRASYSTCSTDGTTFFSYAMEIARKLEDGNVVIVDESQAPSKTTRTQIKALKKAFPKKD